MRPGLPEANFQKMMQLTICLDLVCLFMGADFSRYFLDCFSRDFSQVFYPVTNPSFEPGSRPGFGTAFSAVILLTFWHAKTPRVLTGLNGRLKHARSKGLYDQF